MRLNLTEHIVMANMEYYFNKDNTVVDAFKDWLTMYAKIEQLGNAILESRIGDAINLYNQWVEENK